MSGRWRISGPHVVAELQSLGAMLGPVRFDLGGRSIAPFVVAPWAGDTGAEYAALPGILKRLRGEWPCVPFGSDGARDELDAVWQPQPTSHAVEDGLPHGFGSNNDWELVEHTPSSITVAIGYPAGHAVERLLRTVRAASDRPALELSLSIQVRRRCELPIGLHPVYTLPAPPGTLELQLGAEARAWSFPLEVERGRSLLVPDQRGVPPQRLLAVGGGTIDATRLPLPGESEDLVLLTGLGGRIGLRYPGLGYRIEQRWDASHLPSCLLWISGQGRLYYPWSGRFRGLGVEPVNAPFDLGPATAASPANPLRASGTPTALPLEPGTPFVTRYEIACAAVD